MASKFEIEIMQDALRVHFGYEDGTEADCSPEQPCRIAALYMTRIEADGAYAQPDREEHETEPHRPAAGAPASNQYGTFQVHAASERQAGFLRRLLGERDLSTLDTRNRTEVDRAAASLAAGTLSKKAATGAIDILLTNTQEAVGVSGRPASPKQVEFLRRLLAERQHSLAVDLDTEAPSAASASRMIETLLAAPKVARPAAAELEAGMYLVDGRIYKVYRGQSGRMLAKILRLGEEDTFDMQHGFAHHGRTHFEYQGIASRFVTADQRMNLEQARQFGAIYGVCCNCGATLTDEASIEAGIGPVCARRFAA